MIATSLRDGASAALADMPERLREALSAKASVLAAALGAKVQQKLAGSVLNAHSGAPARSIVTTIEETSAGVAASMEQRRRQIRRHPRIRGGHDPSRTRSSRTKPARAAASLSGTAR